MKRPEHAETDWYRLANDLTIAIVQIRSNMTKLSALQEENTRLNQKVLDLVEQVTRYRKGLSRNRNLPDRTG
jgi:predicted  nucleic acid-binding Zn-ribbon protein